MKKFRFLSILAFTALLAPSCKKALDTPSKEQIDLNEAIKSPDAIKATLTSNYALMRATNYYGRDFIVQAEVLGDNGEITTSNSNRFVSEANNTPRATINIWNTCYVGISRANLVLKYYNTANLGSLLDESQVKGEAYFQRALFYFDLLRVYGRMPGYQNVTLANGSSTTNNLGVPIVTDIILDINDPNFGKKLARNTVDEVFVQIRKDLDSAIVRLTAGETASGTNQAPYRASSLAAQSLYSRVALYQGDWTTAVTMATTAINRLPVTSGKGTRIEFADSATYVGKWGNLHPEMIFGLNYESYETAGFDAIQSIYYKHPVYGGYGDITARLELRNDYYGTNDARFKALIKTTTKGTQTVYYTLKYPGAKSFFGGDDVIIIRVSELYLNRAEAYARLGQDAPAFADVNKIHQRAAPATPLVTGLTGQALLDAIWRERRIELAFEGHRLFDLLRTGRSVVKGTTIIPYTDYRLSGLIPTAETDQNPLLTQNPGY